MNTIKMIVVVAVVSGFSLDAQAGKWSKLKFWQKKEVCCVDSYDCVDSCIEACERESCWSILDRKLFSKSNHWLSDVCGDGCCDVDLAGCCDDNCVPSYCCTENCVDGCVDGCVDHCELARLIYVSQTACKARERKKAVHLIGSRYDCKCNPEVMCALQYALQDCDAHVRAEAADEIGDQIRKNGCCCSCSMTQALKCALNDDSRFVRREAAQALRLCGVKVQRFRWLYRNDCDSDCVDCCVDNACVNSSCTTIGDQWQPAQDTEVIVRPAPKKVQQAPKPVAKPAKKPAVKPGKKPTKKPVKIPQLKPKKPEQPKVDKAVKPAPVAKPKPKPQKKPYVPEEGKTSFIMPSHNFQKLIGFDG